MTFKKALVGLQWGDEGKGKYVTYFHTVGIYDVNARFNGGGNAGHTIFTPKDEELATHQVPSGIVFPGVYNAMLSGMLIEPRELKNEMELLRKRGYLVTPENLGISGLAHVTLMYHKEIEAADEKRRGKKKIGTTKSGIGPTSVDMYGRTGIRFAEFLNPETFATLLDEKKQELKDRKLNESITGINDLVAFYLSAYEKEREFLHPFLIDESELYIDKNKKWLYEGAQGVLLDPEYGSYPFVTSTHAGKAPSDSMEIVGVAKAYITRVGGGPFPTQMDDEHQTKIRGTQGTTGAEFGATTGRPRSCGWFDVPATRYAIRMAHIDDVAITKLDVLSHVPKIKICTHYDCKGKRFDSPPADRFEFAQCTPVYEEVDGWYGIDISDVRDICNLPMAARNYLRKIQDLIGCRIDLVSVGPRAEQTIEMP